MEKLVNIAIGSDPELFIVSQQNQLISSVGLIGGSKHNPIFIPSGEGFQEDNVAVEFNTVPAYTKEQFVASVSRAIEYLSSFMEEHYGHKLLIESAAFFPDEQLQTYQARMFGCDPDYSVWTRERNPSPSSGEETNLRTCGGHVHVSWDNPSEEQMLELVKAMDVFTAAPSTLHDDGKLRRSMYGNIGAYRPKEYGVEYRTLSNYWIKTKKLTEFVYDQTHKAIEFLNSGNSIENEDYELIYKVVNGEPFTEEFYHLTNKYGVL